MNFLTLESLYGINGRLDGTELRGTVANPYTVYRKLQGAHALIIRMIKIGV